LAQMRRFVPGGLAGVAAALLLAAPAPAAPSNVTVRIEGQDNTLVPRTAIHTNDTPVAREPGGTRSCKGTGAMGAIHQATGGDYAGEWSGIGYLLTTVRGEYHYDPYPADPARYWSFWVNYRHMDVGLCDPSFELQEGDDVIILVDCFSATAACESAQPLQLTGLPPTVAPGGSVTVKVIEYSVADPNASPTVTVSQPSAGATVSAGGQSATTAADGTATLTLSTPGPVTFTVTKPNRVRTAGVTCVTAGNDGNCGTQLPPGTPLGTGDPSDRTAPTAAFTGLPRGKVFPRKRAPKLLRGTVSADPSGIRSVRLSILRRRGGRCWAFDGATERFKRHRCGGSRSFRIGDRADWSYLLPRRLPRGRYTIRAIAIDKAGNAAATQTEIRVR
jgi:hypothetical protein